MTFQTPGGSAAKRRRIEAANVALRKPFRSPFINRQQDGASADGTHNSPSVARDTPTVNSTPRAPATPAPTRNHRSAAAAAAAAGGGGGGTSPFPFTSPGLTTTTPQPKRSTNPASGPSRGGGPKRTPATTQSTPTNADKDKDKDTLLHQILASQRKLASDLRAAQQQLDLVRHARRLEQASAAKRPGEPVDAELCEMVARWRAASRMAADELFELIKDRVEGMGGARAWRESRRQQRSFYGGGGGGGRDGGGFDFGGQGLAGGDAGSDDEEERDGDGHERDSDGGKGEEEDEEDEEESEESVSRGCMRGGVVKCELTCLHRSLRCL